MDSPIVLCIDDLPQVLELRRATLESHGYCVKIAFSAYPEPLRGPTNDTRGNVQETHQIRY
jgi:hypothetical protein